MVPVIPTQRAAFCTTVAQPKASFSSERVPPPAMLTEAENNFQGTAALRAAELQETLK